MHEELKEAPRLHATAEREEPLRMRMAETSSSTASDDISPPWWTQLIKAQKVIKNSVHRSPTSIDIKSEAVHLLADRFQLVKQY